MARASILVAVLLGAAQASFDLNARRRVQRERAAVVRAATRTATSVKRSDAEKLQEAAAGVPKRLVATAHPHVKKLYEENGRIEHGDLLAALAALTEASPAAAKPLAAPRARPKISRLGGTDNNRPGYVKCQDETHRGDMCFQAGCSGNCEEGRYFQPPQGFCRSCPDQIWDCVRWGGGSWIDFERNMDHWGTEQPGNKDTVQDCISCCFPSAAPGACSTCGFEHFPEIPLGFAECIECAAEEDEIVVLWDDCTGICASPAAAEQYLALGFAKLAESACIARLPCYEDQDFIKSLPLDGENDCYADEHGGNSCRYAYDGRCDEPNWCDFDTDTHDCRDEDEDDELLNSCRGDFMACVDAAFEAGEITKDDDYFSEDDTVDDYRPCLDDDFPDLHFDDAGGTCDDVQQTAFFQRICENPISVCDDEYMGFVECYMEKVYEEVVGDITTPPPAALVPCDLSCAGARTDSPTPAPVPGSDGAAALRIGVGFAAAIGAAVALLL